MIVLNGVFDENPGSRARFQPASAFSETEVERPEGRAGHESTARTLFWAELTRRVFAVDVLECPRCRGRMRIRSAIQSPEAIRAILDHPGLPS